MSAATRLFASDPHVDTGNALHRFGSEPASYEDLAERFRPIFKKIAEGAVAREQSRTLAFEAVAWLREAGFGALRVPQAHGGLGATLPQTFRLLIELGEADSNLPQIFRAHFAFVEERLNSKDEADRQRWFSLIVEGALFGAAMAEKTEGTETTVTLTKDGARWILDGYKYYSTGTIYSSWIVAVALEGTEYVSLAVPATAKGVTIEDDWDGFGQRLTGSGTTRFHQVAIGEDQILRRVSVEQPPKTSYIIAYYQLFHLAALAGIARAVLKDAIAFTQAKTRTFAVPGKSSPRHDPLVQSVIGRLASLSFTADTLVDGVADAIEEAYRTALKGEDATELIHRRQYQGLSGAADRHRAGARSDDVALRNRRRIRHERVAPVRSLLAQRPNARLPQPAHSPGARHRRLLAERHAAGRRPAGRDPERDTGEERGRSFIADAITHHRQSGIIGHAHIFPTACS